MTPECQTKCPLRYSARSHVCCARAQVLRVDDSLGVSSRTVSRQAVGRVTWPRSFCRTPVTWPHSFCEDTWPRSFCVFTPCLFLTVPVASSALPSRPPCSTLPISIPVTARAVGHPGQKHPPLCYTLARGHPRLVNSAGPTLVWISLPLLLPISAILTIPAAAIPLATSMTTITPANA